VPLGAFGMSAFLLDLYFARPGAAPVGGLQLADFLAQPGSTRIIIDLLGIGFATGLFVVPLFALIQSRTPNHQMARVFAALNIQNSGFIVAAAGVGLLTQQLLGWSAPQLLLALAIANALVAVWIFSIVPEFAMRFASWLMVRTLYRLRVEGVEEHVPDEGAAVLVCNHVSYMDALILAAVIPRPVRFVMYYKIFNIPFMRWIFRTARAIPIASPKEDAALMQRAFDSIDQALANGELVLIFPEGKLTADGQINPFKSGVEKILQRRPVPVVPMALRGMWASMWSRRDSRLGRMRVPRRLRARIQVIAQAALPASSTAAELEACVRGLRGEHA
jgi:1-acyl-sn-glycerol-3-phosphate acyltransferase